MAPGSPQQLAAAREQRAALTTQLTAVLESVDAIAGPAGEITAV
jgi:hypothetical protein